MGNPLISIIVPVYNEKQNVFPTAESVIKTFGIYKNKIEILFVDDDSPDGTANEVISVSNIFPCVKLIQHGNKQGIGAAHKAGLLEAKGEYIMYIDADLSQCPKDLIRMKNKLDEGYDLVIGSRYVTGGEMIGKSFLRNLGSRFMNITTWYLLGIPVRDATTTFRVFKKKLFNNITNKIKHKGHPGYQVEFSFWATLSDWRISEIPVTFIERLPERGVSKLSLPKEALSFVFLLMKLMIFRILWFFKLIN